MADPLTWAILGTTMSVIGAVGGTTAGIFGSVQNQRQMEANAKAQEQMFDYNRRQELIEANNVEKETQAADIRQREEQARLRASQRALYAKSGASMTAGSPLAVLGETAATQQIESSDLRRQGATEYNRRISAANSYAYQAQIARKSVNRNSMWTSIGSSLAEGIGNAGASIISGVSGYNQLKK